MYAISVETLIYPICALPIFTAIAPLVLLNGIPDCKRSFLRKIFSSVVASARPVNIGARAAAYKRLKRTGNFEDLREIKFMGHGKYIFVQLLQLSNSIVQYDTSSHRNQNHPHTYEYDPLY